MSEGGWVIPETHVPDRFVAVDVTDDQGRMYLRADKIISVGTGIQRNPSSLKEGEFIDTPTTLLLVEGLAQPVPVTQSAEQVIEWVEQCLAQA